MDIMIKSILIGVIPDVIFLSLFIIYSKKIQTRRVIFFILLLIDYIVTLIIFKYQTLFYILFIVIEYIILRLLYKKEIQLIDSFVITIPFLILFLMSCIYYFLIPNYMLACILEKITILIMIFLIKNKINIAYKTYRHLWNRTKEEARKIRSITLRNISLILMYIFIFLSDLVCIYIMNVRW